VNSSYVYQLSNGLATCYHHHVHMRLPVVMRYFFPVDTLSVSFSKIRFNLFSFYVLVFQAALFPEVLRPGIRISLFPSSFILHVILLDFRNKAAFLSAIQNRRSESVIYSVLLAF